MCGDIPGDRPHHDARHSAIPPGGIPLPSAIDVRPGPRVQRAACLATCMGGDVCRAESLGGQASGLVSAVYEVAGQSSGMLRSALPNPQHRRLREGPRHPRRSPAPAAAAALLLLLALPATAAATVGAAVSHPV